MVIPAGTHTDGGGGALEGRVVLALGALAGANAGDDVKSALDAQRDEGRTGCIADGTPNPPGRRAEVGALRRVPVCFPT
jgi:hypothetical protein